LSNGAFDVRITKLKPGAKFVGSAWHYHTVDAHIVYIIKGWMRFEYEGVGEITLGAGTVFWQPPMNRHREIETSDDIEVLEVTSPGHVGTHLLRFNEDTKQWEQVDYQTADFRE
jgi:quercetin dioxygenase-like cupin family protein